MMTAEKICEVVRAIEQGKAVECYHHGWTEVKEMSSVLVGISQGLECRVKPLPASPKLRHWTCDEVPMNADYRSKDDKELRTRILSVSNPTVFMFNFLTTGKKQDVLSIQTLFDFYEHRLDGTAEWKPCGVEE